MVGIEVTDIKEGYAKVRMPVKQIHLNPIGSVHGACLFTIAATAAGASAASYGLKVTTLEADIHYFCAGLNASCLYGEACEIKSGKRTLVYRVSVTDQDGKILNESIFTFMVLETSIK